MIQLGFIVPVKYLHRFATQSHFHLILPHIVEQSKEYHDFYKERRKLGDFVVLDNSIFELERSYPKEKLLDIAQDLNVSELVVPEVLRCAEDSLRVVEDFFNYVEKSSISFSGQFAVTIQGETFTEMITYARTLLKVFGDHFETFCIPFDIDCDVPNAPYFKSLTLQRVVNRICFCQHLYEEGLVLNKQVHLLGLSDGVELQHYTLSGEKFSFIRSNDSSSAFVHGMHGVKYTDKGLPCEKIKKKLDFLMEEQLSSEQLETIQYNIIKLKSFVGEKEKKEEENEKK